jgi:hypothetical protein
MRSQAERDIREDKADGIIAAIAGEGE